MDENDEPLVLAESEFVQRWKDWKAQERMEAISQAPEYLPEAVAELFIHDTCVEGRYPWHDVPEDLSEKVSSGDLEQFRDTFRRICRSPKMEGFWRGPFGRLLARTPGEVWCLADCVEQARTEAWPGLFGSIGGFPWILESRDARKAQAARIAHLMNELRDAVRETVYDKTLGEIAAWGRMRRDWGPQSFDGPSLSEQLEVHAKRAEALADLSDEAPTFYQQSAGTTRRAGLPLELRLVMVATYRFLERRFRSLDGATQTATEKAAASIASTIFDQSVSHDQVKDALRSKGRR